MLKHETKLIDPDAEQIVAALTQATADANKRCRKRLLADKPPTWRKFARDSAAKPEGYAMFRGGSGGIPATQLLAAWWTDAIGRKHVVIRGRRIEHTEAKRLLHKAELDERPPLWHAYPEYVCRRTAGEQSQIVCACGCGAVGTPESLGWMGATCGPCFDRKEEAGAESLHANLPGVLYGDREPLGAVACSPDGTRVAAVEGHDAVTYWDLATRTRTMVKFNEVRVRDVSITSDARHLLVVGGDELGYGGLFACFDLSTDPPTRVDPRRTDELGGGRIAALPDPGLALRHRLRWLDRPPGLEVIRLPSGDAVHGLNFVVGPMGRFALSTDASRLATCASEMSVYDITGLTQARRIANRDTSPLPVCVAFGAGERLFGAFGGTIGEFAEGELVAQNWLSNEISPPPTEYLTALAADPKGEWLCAAGLLGRVYAFNPDTLKMRAVFDWHLGTVTGLAASVDGSRLFSSGADGCVKMWPIRELLK